MHSAMIAPDEALPCRDEVMQVPEEHFVNGNPLAGPWPDGMEIAVVGMGCFWGAERLFWQLEASTRPLPGMPVASRRTVLTKRTAQAVRATLRPSALCLIRQ